MSFKGYINSLSKFQIFQLYFIVSILILFPYFKFIDTKENKQTYTNENFVKLNTNIIEMKEKIVLPKPIKVLKELEKQSLKYKSLTIQNFSINKNSINLNGISNQSDFFKFLIYCENYSFTSRVNTLSLKPTSKEKFYNFSFSIKFKDKYLAKISDKQNQKIQTMIESLENKKEKKFKLQAILNNQVIINDKLLSIGDKIDKYKIKQIHKKYIILSNKTDTKKLFIKSTK